MFSTKMHTPFTYFRTWKTFSKRKTIQNIENCNLLNARLPSWLFYCLLPSLHIPSPTALPQNAGTLYPDTSPPTDNSLATNYRPFPDMENQFSTNYGLPSCLFRCLLPSLLGRFSIPWTVCAQIPGLSGLKIDNSILIYSQKMTPLLLIITK